MASEAGNMSEELKPVAFPPLPKGYVTLDGLTRYDAMQVHQYALRYADAIAAAQPQQAASLPHPDVTWLWTHCRAMGMTRKSDSGSFRDDVALFVADLHDAAKAAQPRPPLGSIPPGWKVISKGDPLGTITITSPKGSTAVVNAANGPHPSNVLRELVLALAVTQPQQAAQPVAQEPRVCWLVEEFSASGNSTGRYMLDQSDLTITTDVQKARQFRGSRTATFRATDMREKWGTSWRPVSHVFRAAQPQQAEGDTP